MLTPPSVPLNMAILLLILSILGTLLGVRITLFVLRKSTLRRLRGVLGAPVRRFQTESEDLSALAGVEDTAHGLLQLVCAESECSFALLLLPKLGAGSLVVTASEGEAAELSAFEVSRFHPLIRRLEKTGVPTTISESDEDLSLPANATLIPILSRRPRNDDEQQHHLIGIVAAGPRGSGRAITSRSLATVAQTVAKASAQFENAQLYNSLRRAFSDLETAQREQFALQRVSLSVQSTLHLYEVLDEISRGVVDVSSFATATVYLVDAKRRTLSMPVGHGGSAASMPSSEPIPFDDGNASMRALLANEVLVTDDVRDSVLPRLIEAGALTSRDLMSDTTVVNLPLASKGQVIGGMALTTSRRIVSDREIESLQSFTAQGAAAIENARFYGELEQAYTDLRSAQDQLIQAERLRTLGQVASGVAHDFNNILVAIVTHAQLAKDQTRSASMRESLHIIEQAALHGAKVARRIRELARPKTDRVPEQIDLNAVVQQALDLTRPTWVNDAQARGVSITTETSLAARTTVEGQSSELRDVITNLILNATAAMPEGGTLTLCTEDHGDDVCCLVADTGVGMTEEVKQQVFDPFFTTKGASGSGLGMSIVAAILERHRGRIEIESEPGRGTSVRLRFPAQSAQVAGSKPRRRRAHISLSLRLLVVEEDERTRDALRLILIHHGHQVSAVASAEESIRALVEQEFDVIITGLGLGEHSGWEVAQACKTIRPSAAVVLVTAWALQWEPEEVRTRGVDGILSKPFTVDEVLTCLGDALVRSV